MLAPNPHYTGTMRKMCDQGDTSLHWDKDNPDEVAVARATFERLTKDGEGGKVYQAFSVGRRGQRGERMTTFDPAAEQIVLAPQLQAG